MTEAQKEYEPVDWHGEHLRIDQDKKGRVSISHPPFETCFNPEEMREIAQFINKYCSVPVKSDAVLGTPIICLCGSTRFTREMLIKQWELTKQGYIVVSWCALPDDYYQGDGKAHIGERESVKAVVDEIHKRKIDLADEVLVIDIGGYIGTSTRSEIHYAIKHGKPVRYISEELRQQKER